MLHILLTVLLKYIYTDIYIYIYINLFSTTFRVFYLWQSLRSWTGSFSDMYCSNYTISLNAATDIYC